MSLGGGFSKPEMGVWLGRQQDVQLRQTGMLIVVSAGNSSIDLSTTETSVDFLRLAARRCVSSVGPRPIPATGRTIVLHELAELRGRRAAGGNAVRPWATLSSVRAGRGVLVRRVSILFVGLGFLPRNRILGWTAANVPILGTVQTHPAQQESANRLHRNEPSLPARGRSCRC
jgi:hypothetical protein